MIDTFDSSLGDASVIDRAAFVMAEVLPRRVFTQTRYDPVKLAYYGIEVVVDPLAPLDRVVLQGEHNRVTITNVATESCPACRRPF